MVDPSLRVGDVVSIYGSRFRLTDFKVKANCAPEAYLTSLSEEMKNADVSPVQLIRDFSIGPGPEEAGEAESGDSAADQGADYPRFYQNSGESRRCGVAACTICYPTERVAESPGKSDVEGPREGPDAVPGGDLR